MDSMLNIKSDLDPFELYGMKNLNEDVEDIQSARIKLAVLKAKNKLSDDEDVISQADHDLEQVMGLETYKDPPKPLKVLLVPKLENIDAEVKLLQTIHETFARIFQALIVMLEDKSLFTQLPNEAEKLSKRSREFEVRLNRSVFEAKQQFVSYQAILVKFSLKPKDETRKLELGKRVHSVLRCVHLILQSYLKHLPLSGGHVYPASLFKFIEMCQNFWKSTKNIMAVDDKLEMFQEDVIRLFNAAKAFEKKFAESSKNLTSQVKTPNKVVAKKKPPTASKKKQKNTPLDVEMISNLAREKFGTPPVTLEVMKDTKSPSPRPKSALISDDISSTIKDGVSILGDQPQFHEKLNGKTKHHDNTEIEFMDPVKDVSEDMLNFDAPKEIEMNTILSHHSNMTDKRKSNQDHSEIKNLESHFGQNLSASDGTKISGIIRTNHEKTLSEHSKISIKHEVNLSQALENNISKLSSSRQILNQLSSNKCITILEIDNEELMQIENLRHMKQMIDLKSVPACVAHMNPVKLVSEIADKVVLKIVQHVCHEAVDQDLVQRLVQAELVTA